MNPEDRFPRSSSFYIYDNCDLSFELCQQAGEEPATIFSDRGTKIHGVWAGRVPAQLLDLDERSIYDRLEERYEQRVRAWLGDEAKPHQELTEERLWWRMGLRQIYSGQPDRVLVVRERAYIPDFKTGWHPLDAIAATNCQLRSYVPLVSQNIDGIEEITVDIIKPGKMSPPAVFNSDLIDQAKAWALNTVARVRKEGEKKPNRGVWCQYCSGKVLCPAWKTEIQALALGNQLLAQATDDMLRELGPRLDIAAKVIERLKARLEQRVREAPELFKDWRFDKGDTRRRIVSLTLAYQRMSAEGVSATDFISACNGKVTELESIYRKKKGLKTIEGAIAFNKLLGSALESHPNKDKLVYVPALPESEPIEAETKTEASELPFM
jgi:hypothetical protein